MGASTMRYTSALLVAGVSRAWLSESEKDELSDAREVEAADGDWRWSCTSTMRQPVGRGPVVSFVARRSAGGRGRTVVVDDAGVVQDVEEVGRELLLAHGLEEALHRRVVAEVAVLRASSWFVSEPLSGVERGGAGTHLVLEAEVGRVQVDDE